MKRNLRKEVIILEIEKIEIVKEKNTWWMYDSNINGYYLFKVGPNYDINIEVGNDPYIKIFHAHMVILNYRSPYDTAQTIVYLCIIGVHFFKRGLKIYNTIIRK